MFGVNRFDPRQEEQQQEQRTRSTSRKRSRQKRDSATGESSSAKLDDVVRHSNECKNSGGESDSSTSSSRPGSSEKQKRNHREESSAESTGKDLSNMKVIAPEVKIPSITRGGDRKAVGASEAFDDLDLIIASEEDTHELVEDDGGEDNDLTSEEIANAMAISKLPIAEAAQCLQLAPFLVENLRTAGFTSLFPIQALVLPDVVHSERVPHIRARDICISAPTGSGKTLAFVLPILNSLCSRKIRRLRALVVLPSRDLATQVYDVFQQYAQGSDLKVGIAIGQTDFKAEQIQLTVDMESQSVDDLKHRFLFEPDNLELALYIQHLSSGSLTDVDQTKARSNVDILVCTPGRLVDHIDNTPGFSLQHLRFLVVDEADRLLNQRFHNWVDKVFESASKVSNDFMKKIYENGNKMPDIFNAAGELTVHPMTWRRGTIDGKGLNEFESASPLFQGVAKPTQLRKFLASATMTRDPQKLASIGLLNPKYFDVHQFGAEGSSQKYSVPENLSERLLECKAEQKPLFLFAILLDLMRQGDDKAITVVFTSSLDSTHRLARLLQVMWKISGTGECKGVLEFSSAKNQHERKRLVERCNDPDTDVAVVVCSDGMSRGMDLDRVRTVINYDVPSFAKTYIHRCGRTARAGKDGTAITFVKTGQKRLFERMRSLINDSSRVSDVSVSKSIVLESLDSYKKSVQILRKVLAAEDEGDLKVSNVIPPDYMLQ